MTCDGRVLACAMLQEANWSRSSSCWDMSRFKRPSDTLAASSGFGRRSMIASESNQIAESPRGSGRVADHTDTIAAFTSRHSASHGRLGKMRTTGLDGFNEFLTLRRGRGTAHNAGVMMVFRSYACDCTSEGYRR